MTLTFSSPSYTHTPHSRPCHIGIIQENKVALLRDSTINGAARNTAIVDA
jgi:hypothetical protein